MPVMTHERMSLFLALLALCTAPLADQITDQARELLNSHQAGSAYTLLAPLADERAGDPDFDYLLGIAALDSGQPG